MGGNDMSGPDLKLCRICLTKSASISIFSLSAAPIAADEEPALYRDQIMRCARVQIAEDDGLPAYMCSTCEAELVVSYRFLVKCEVSDATLRKQYAKVEISVKQENVDRDYEDLKSEYLDDEFLFEDCLPLKVKHKRGKTRKKRDTATAVEIPIVEAKKEQVKEETDEPEDIKPLKRKRGRPRKNDNSVYPYDPHRRPIAKIPCPTCGLMTFSPSALKIHMLVHTGEKPYSCPSCSKAFKAKGTLKRHIEKRHETATRERKYVCETCGDRFYNKSDIIFHMRRHTGEKPHACPFCPARFIQIGSLLRHKRSHTGERPYPCPKCDKSFACSTSRVRHMAKHSNERKYPCHLCEKVFKTKQCLTIHIRLHSNQKMFVCSFCGVAFAAKGNLKNHMERLHSEKSGQCEICHKTYSNLPMHMNMHTGNVPFKCDKCPRAFPVLRSLVNHIKIKHDNTEKFKCPEDDCDFSAPIQSMLKFHIHKQHTNETPFVCQHCSRGFFRLSDLNRHLNVSHNVVAVNELKREPALVVV